jgi:hypothetical protein
MITTSRMNYFYQEMDGNLFSNDTCIKLYSRNIFIINKTQFGYPRCTTCQLHIKEFPVISAEHGFSQLVLVYASCFWHRCTKSILYWSSTLKLATLTSKNTSIFRYAWKSIFHAWLVNFNFQISNTSSPSYLHLTMF